MIMREKLIRWFNRTAILKWLFYSVLYRAWVWFWSGIEAIAWTLGGDKSEAMCTLLFIQGASCQSLSDWYKSRRFPWKSDPLGGKLDFRSRPWVSVAKNHGDCDDMAELAFLVLGGYDLVQLVCVAGERGGHAVCVAMKGDQWWMMNNQHETGPFDTREQAILASLDGEIWLTVTVKERVDN